MIRFIVIPFKMLRPGGSVQILRNFVHNQRRSENEHDTALDVPPGIAPTNGLKDFNGPCTGLRLPADKVDKNVLSGAALFAFAWASPHVFAVGLHIPGRAIVVFINLQSLFQLLFQLRVGNGYHGFHAAVKVAPHPVGRAGEEFGVTTVFKAIDTSVFQKATEGAENPNIFGQAGDPARRQHMPRTLRLMGTPAWPAR